MAHTVERRGACRVLVGKPDGRRLLEIPGHRWEDSIQMDVEGVGAEHVNRMGMGGDRETGELL
jgi:hypothetical protein